MTIQNLKMMITTWYSYVEDLQQSDLENGDEIIQQMISLALTIISHIESVFGQYMDRLEFDEVLSLSKFKSELNKFILDNDGGFNE